MEFQEIGDNYQDFFKILPQDWQEVIRPLWKDYKKSANIYALLDEKQLVAGGIVFRTAPPNRTEFEIAVGEEYVVKGYHYIGFLFVDPKRRNEALGTRWLSALKSHFPEQGFWLTIEEQVLETFYVKNGFVRVSESADVGVPEWMFIYEPI